MKIDKDGYDLDGAGLRIQTNIVERARRLGKIVHLNPMNFIIPEYKPWDRFVRRSDGTEIIIPGKGPSE